MNFVGAELSPSKAFSASLPPDKHEVLRRANITLHSAVNTLLTLGVRPRWVFETVNRFIYLNQIGQPDGILTADTPLPPLHTAYDDTDPPG
jgi:hypothetical protein